MKIALRVFIFVLVLASLTASLAPVAATAASPGFVVVVWGDTLAAIAARNGTTVDALVRTNNLPSRNFIYAGQRLALPSANNVPGAPVVAPVGNIYTVNYGDTLASIASRFGTSINEVMRVNALRNPNYIYAGQRLNIPGRTAPLPAPALPNVPAPLPAPSNPAVAPTTGRWIDVDLGDQKITAFQNTAPLKSVLASTGVAWYPTPIGHFKVYTKIASQTMSGGSGANSYYLPGVPWVMYFTGAYAIHGTYWHHNFGQPMSHGCVNLTIEDAKWFYDFAEIGTPVVVHP